MGASDWAASKWRRCRRRWCFPRPQAKSHEAATMTDTLLTRLSPMLARLRPSATVATTEKARQRKATDPSVLVISGGEPAFDTPENTKEAAIEAIRLGDTKYTSTAGTPALKAAIVAKFKDENGLDYRPEEI